MFKNKEGKVRSGWKIAAVTAAFFLITQILSILVLLPYTLIYFLENFNNNIEEITKNITSNQLIQSILIILQDIVLILTVLISWKFILKQPLSKMGLTSLRTHKKDFFVGLLLGAVNMSIVFIIIVFSGNAVIESNTLTISSDMFLFLFIFILVGFAEEIYGRGFIMSTLKQTKSYPIILILSSVIFALMHSGNNGISFIPYLNLFLVALLLAYTYIKSGNLWLCIGYHITWNYFQGNIYGFKVSGINTTGLITTAYDTNNIINGGSFGPEGGLIVTAITLISFLFIRLYYKNSHYKFLTADNK